jgi:hypothetical protein
VEFDYQLETTAKLPSDNATIGKKNLSAKGYLPFDFQSLPKYTTDDLQKFH